MTTVRCSRPVDLCTDSSQVSDGVARSCEGENTGSPSEYQLTPAVTPSSARRTLNIAMVCDGIGHMVAGSLISTMRFAELLKARGHRVVFISSGSRQSRHDHEYRGIKIYRLLGVLVPRSDGQLYLAVPFANTVRNILRDERFDVVHVMTPMLLGLVAVRVAKVMRIPIVMHSHTQPENIFMNAPKFPGRDALSRGFYSYLNWIYQQADVMVYPSTFSRWQFPDLAKSRNMVISNGVNLQKFQPTHSDEFMRRLSLSKAKQILMYLGRLHREKNVATLIQAMPIILKKNPRAHLLIAGLGYDRPMLNRLVRKLDLTTHVTFCGFVPDEDLAAAYSACDLFVLPSLVELESMVVLEAMSCGKPLLVADSKGSAAVSHVVENGLLFRAQDPEHLAAQASRLLSNPEGLQAMAEMSLKESRHFDINLSAAAIESLYYSLLPTP